MPGGLGVAERVVSRGVRVSRAGAVGAGPCAVTDGRRPSESAVTAGHRPAVVQAVGLQLGLRIATFLKFFRILHT